MTAAITVLGLPKFVVRLMPLRAKRLKLVGRLSFSRLAVVPMMSRPTS